MTCERKSARSCSRLTRVRAVPYYHEPNLRFDDPLARRNDPRTYQGILDVEYHEIQYTATDPNAPGVVWQFAGTSKKSRFDLENLPTGQKVWVQVRACNARGKSPWSDPACKRVP
jgi:hypothetical protein